MIYQADVWSVMATLIGGAMGAKVVEYGINKIRKDKTDKMIDNMENLSALYQEFDKLLIATDEVDRISIFKGHNSGGVPRPGSPFYVTPIHWEYRDKNEMPPSIQNLQMDGESVNMLLASIKSGMVGGKTDELKDSMIKRTSMALGITYAEIYNVHITKKETFYLTINSKSAANFDNLETRVAIDFAVSSIRNIFAMYADL